MRRAKGVKSDPAKKLAALKEKTGNYSAKQVDTILELILGSEEAAKIQSNCLKKAIQRKFIPVFEPNGLDYVFLTGGCEGCGGDFPVTVRSVLAQPDYAGTDYEEGCENASAKCPHCKAPSYVTRMCEGQPILDSGKFHNHCTQCPGFGKCIGDYREKHCPTCKKHFFAGLMGGDCPRCNKDDGSDGDDDDGGFF